MLLCHDCVKKRAPQNISSQLVSEQATNAYQTRNQSANPLNLKIPNLKSRVGSQSFRVKGPMIWNKIPCEIKSIERREIFKSSYQKNVFT